MEFSPGFYLVFVISLLAAEYLLGAASDILNIRHIDKKLPEDFTGFYNDKDYEKSQNYLMETTKFELISSTFVLFLTITFIIVGGFGWVDRLARSFSLGEIATGIIFIFILKTGVDILEIPFETYETFVIENKYGFNRTAPKTFVTDILKEWCLSIIIGAPVAAAVFFIFGNFGKQAWLYVWFFIILVQLFVSFLAPVLILPLFNKFSPVKDENLKKTIEEYLQKNNFRIKGIYVMDGSKRSTKTNAFFIGFGKFKKIVLYDTLIKKHSPEEICAILAHEIGHYKKKHILISGAFSFANLGLMLYLLQMFIGNENLFKAFKMDHVSVYGGIVFFGFIYSPISLILSLLLNMLSRKFERQADKFAAETTKDKETMIKTLKKLTVENLGNLKPHPLKVFLYYSHPPVIERIKFIKSL